MENHSDAVKHIAEIFFGSSDCSAVAAVCSVTPVVTMSSMRMRVDPRGGARFVMTLNERDVFNLSDRDFLLEAEA